jgi:16S rRNA (guanine966-N2)-methyltransferase
LQAPSKSTAKYSGQLIRPTADRAREALFSIIGRKVENATVLDLYAGTGALGLEALSRSAERAVFVDNNLQAFEIINKNIELCGFSDRGLVFKWDLSKGLSFLAKKLPDTTFSLVFIDPPYRKGLAADMLQELAKSGILCPEALVVAEENALTELPQQVAELTLYDQRQYGETGFWFYRQKHSFINTPRREKLHGREN